MKPQCDAAGVKLFLVSIGSAETGKEFASGTEFPEDSLFADTENACYDALNFYTGVMRSKCTALQCSATVGLSNLCSQNSLPPLSLSL